MSSIIERMSGPLTRGITSLAKTSIILYQERTGAHNTSEQVKLALVSQPDQSPWSILDQSMLSYDELCHSVAGRWLKGIESLKHIPQDSLPHHVLANVLLAVAYVNEPIETVFGIAFGAEGIKAYEAELKRITGAFTHVDDVLQDCGAMRLSPISQPLTTA